MDDRLASALAALSDAERRLAETQQLTHAGSWELDLATDTLWWSDETFRIFEIPRGAAPSYATFLALVHPDDRELVDRAYTQSVAERVPYEVEHRLRMPDGRVKYVHESARTFYDDRGTAVRSVGSVQDVTARVEQQQRQRISEYRLRVAVDVAGLGLFDHDHRADIIDWSPRQREIFGVDPQQAITPSDFTRLIHPDDRAWVLALVQRSHDPGGDGECAVEHRIVRPDGAVRWIVARFQTEFDGEGDARRPVRTAGAVMDVTGLHTVDAAMRVRDRAIVSAITPIAFADGDGRITFVNPAFVQTWGYESEHEILGLRPTDLAEPETTAAALRQLTEGRPFQGELVARRKDGTTFDVLLLAHALYDANGRLTHMMGSFLDLSESKRLQAQLLQAQKMESIGRLAGGVAHDFNNLLTVIKGFTDLTLADLDARDPRHEALVQVENAADAASRLTQQLLAFSRKQVINPDVLDLHEVIVSLEGLLRRLVGEDIDLRVRSRDAGVLVRFDRSQCEQILVNLAANARDAMPEGGWLTIEAAIVTLDEEFCRIRPGVAPGQFALLAVSDSGVGMDAATKAHLFEPFFTTKAPGRGTGLGLPMVFGAVAQNGGRIDVYSEVGYGTTFKIYLPLATGETAAVVSPAREIRLAKGTETILLVEDDEAVRRLATQVLTRAGYKVHSCAAPDEALRELEAFQGDLALLITDMIMPGMNGRALTERVRAIRPDMRVLFTSGYTDDVIADRGVLDPGTNFLQKPYSIAQLTSSVRDAINRPPR